MSFSIGGTYDDFLESFNYDNTGDAARDIAKKFGSGHKEAELIVPHANQLAILLDQVNAEINNPGVTTDRLHQLREYLVAGMTAYQNILAAPWPDGRAARQGYEVMFGNDPGYARLTLENLDRQLLERSGGIVTTVTTAVGGGNNLVLAGLAVAAFLVLRK